MKIKDKKKFASILGILGVLFITTGVTYAFFTYTGTGRKENTIESGSVKFHYAEGANTLSLTDAMPMSDEQGKAQTNYFEFTITSKSSKSIKIPYFITLRKKGNDNSLDNAVKFYLTTVDNNTESPMTLETENQISKFSELTTYTNDKIGITAAKNEKLLYIAEVPVNATRYEEHYRLRMWLSNDATYTQSETGVCSDTTYTTEEDCVAAHKDWTTTATPETKTFTVTVNVYAEGEANVAPLSASNVSTTQGISLQEAIDNLAEILN